MWKIATVFLMVFVSCAKVESPEPQNLTEEVKMNLKSSAFKNMEFIPPKYTADGEDISPPLQIENVPEVAKSLVLIVDDPDAPIGNWDHWIVFNIPSGTSKIPEGETPEGLRGTNDFGRLDWGGPAPPSGVHRYFFKLYALDTILDIKEGARKKEIEKTMKGHILAQATLIGKYARKR